MTVLAWPTLLPGQDALERGRTAMASWDLPTARRFLEEAVRQAPDSHEANWRLAHVLLDLGKETPDTVVSATRDTLYAHAESYARAAIAANPTGVEGYFLLASAIGRASLTLGKRERIARAVEIRNAALRALGLDPTHDGAHHVMGRWHAEIMRLSSLQRFFAKNFLGATIFDEASWDAAERHLRLAVESGPDRIYHRLDLAEVLVDREQPEAALDQLDTIARLPVLEPMDVQYRRQAARLAERLRARQGG